MHTICAYTHVQYVWADVYVHVYVNTEDYMMIFIAKYIYSNHIRSHCCCQVSCTYNGYSHPGTVGGLDSVQCCAN